MDFIPAASSQQDKATLKTETIAIVIGYEL